DILMKDINITPETNYQIKLPEGMYYPALLDVFDLSGWVETFFYLPDEKNNLVLKSRTINALNLDHLSFPDGEKKSPKIFIHRGLAELLGSCGFSHISDSLIKKASEIQDYDKYFDIFKTKESKDIFSKFAGSLLFPDKK
ncbi:MAG: hypothetical protein NTZ83_03935, partial [Candidatus Pacearchaeota archaeon]|nr:hypothetical protein [Candidatus Pacearchaeota archaeon]